ncbi:glycosyl hydrolase 38 domain protein [Runella slithyformis DSM 19594]|uniref:Glycosyl hydrolase 38 domain protein n=2 Tax=Runella TaxID=105 RepID=A0A7U3ZPN3_RUNSL|nr:glycosyl hydrolase 38 domain protein [Runella slithyformis DSM 19594]
MAILLLFGGAANAQQKRLYLANDEHTDYMWTGTEAQYDSVMVKMLDYYLDQIDATARRPGKNNPADFQARFNCDGSYWLRVYDKFRTPAQFNRLVAALRSGHISSPLNTLVSTYGAQPTEAVIRGMYYAGQMERRLGVRFPLAVCMENQTLPLGLSSLWAGSGAKYSWRGVCACASRIPNAGFAHRKHQLYRYMGMDGRGVTMKWYNLKTGNKSLGGYAESRQQTKSLDPSVGLNRTIEILTALCDTISEKSAYPYNVAGAFGYGWDDLDTYVSPDFITAAQNGTTPQRKVRVSNEVDFFEDVARTYPKLPSESVSYGNEWDTYCVSMNETSAKVRRATEKLRAAEALASIVSLKNKTFGNNLAALRQKAWDGYGLFWEHDWTADGPVKPKERAEWQIKMQQQVSGYSDSLFNQSLHALGNQLQKATNPRFYVFNPLSWVRNDVADAEYAGSLPVKVVDVSTGKETASQVVIKNGKQYLRIRAEKLPSVGYKVFEIQQGSPAALPQAAAVSGNWFKNAFYRIRLLKSGVISELYDSLANGKQLVKVIDGKYLNDLGINNADEGAPLVLENAGPVSVTLKAVSNFPVLHTVRVTLFKDSPRIEIQDSIQANFSDLKTWAFSFNLTHPTTRHEELGAILTAKNDRNGGHYASQTRTGGPARYDWLTFNHFADLSEANYGVTLSNQDCSFFKLGNSTPDSLWEQSAQLNALAGGQTDGPKLGIPAQNGNGDFLYQFALTTHHAPFDQTAAMKFALEHQNPLVTGRITGENGDPRKTFSLLSVSDPNVLLWSVKPSEEGIKNGLITRFWNLNAKPVKAYVKLSKPLKAAWQTTHVETNEQSLTPVNGTLNAVFNQHQLKTYRLKLK